VSALLKFDSKPAIPLPTQFLPFELIGWNIKAAGRETPQLLSLTTPFSISTTKKALWPFIDIAGNMNAFDSTCGEAYLY
jgi:hypothetical protein